jgi:hypothetical protein
VQTLPAGNSPVGVSANIASLSPSTTYHFRLVADNGGSAVSGTGAQFTTADPPPPPTVATGSFSNVGASGATVTGTVNPNGRPAAYHFEYGISTSYTSSTPTQTLPAGTSPVGVTATLSGLSSSTTYHYRLVADTGGTPVGGGDKQFSTTAPPPGGSLAPTSTTIETGSAAGGSAASLAAADSSYFSVSAGFVFTPFSLVTSWYGTFTGLPASPASLAVSYTGNNSTACNQVLQILRWSDATWVTLDTRSIGPADVAIANLAPPGAASQYVSGGSARVRVRCPSAGLFSFTANGNLLRLAYG